MIWRGNFLADAGAKESVALHVAPAPAVQREASELVRIAGLVCKLAANILVLWKKVPADEIREAAVGIRRIATGALRVGGRRRAP